MSCICSEVEHSYVDKVIQSELRQVITADEILNKGYCVSIDLDNISDSSFCLSTNEKLRGLKGKMGIYHLWVKYDYCGDHQDNYRMLCAYVGKGDALVRVKSHIKEKWSDSEVLYVSFYECENRIAKYLEQLFLDTYNFYLNKSENIGENYLFTLWDDFRRVHGTELHEHSEMLAEKFPEMFNPFSD